MAGTSEGVKKSWLKRKRGKGRGKKVDPVKEFGRPETQDTLPKGFTLREMAKKWKVSVTELIKLNGFTKKEQIVGGMTVKIPAIKPRKQREAEAEQKAIEANAKKIEREKKKAEREAKKKK